MNWYRVTWKAPGLAPAVCEVEAHSASDAMVCALVELGLTHAKQVTPARVECIEKPERRQVDRLMPLMRAVEPPK